MCFVITLPVKVVLCPKRESKNLHPGLSNAPYSEFKLIFLTNCLLSQNSVSILFPAFIASRILACISFLSAYHLSSRPGIIPSTSNVKIVPFALNPHFEFELYIISYTSAALITCSSPFSQSTVIVLALSFSITA